MRRLLLSKINNPTNFAWGKIAESLCVWTLRLKGYKILARRFRGPGGEIDIIAKRGQCLAFIEVKARADLLTAATALSAYQQKRIEKTAHFFLSRNERWKVESVRFDVMLVTPWGLPHHIVDAWRPEAGHYF